MRSPKECELRGKYKQEEKSWNTATFREQGDEKDSTANGTTGRKGPEKPLS